ncbi:hypothetical protein JJQ72_09735 [Paenibacillus sp. F411]|uniref:Uncharacterized protein n=1 Tax=Paenibacillus algicola TaxID=2565926 RepID=A0A4P8XRD7_9BACL|nr:MULTISPECIES: hypothetical protein [Paenibacillus]MBO2944246.1 hypothetical protein [Paenibacillus sp. F411]QCT03039.1 hypothetical protein E6C60_2327 [Paenibacillus algicola]
MRKTALWTAVGAGAAYLLRNKDSRQKLMNQFQDLKGKYFSNAESSQSSVSQGSSVMNTSSASGNSLQRSTTS